MMRTSKNSNVSRNISFNAVSKVSIVVGCSPAGPAGRTDDVGEKFYCCAVT